MERWVFKSKDVQAGVYDMDGNPVYLIWGSGSRPLDRTRGVLAANSREMYSLLKDLAEGKDKTDEAKELLRKMDEICKTRPPQTA